MALTLEERRIRRKYIGSSDMAAILGVSKWANAYDVWLEKTNRIPLDDVKEDEAKKAGSVFEAGILDEAEKQLGKLRRNVLCVRPEFNLGSRSDAVVDASNDPVEAKTAGLFAPLDGVWGEEWSDEVPNEYIVQTHVHMICLGSTQCFLPTFLGGRGFQMFKVNLNNRLVDIIIQRAEKFWNCVKTDTPPDNVIPSMDVISRAKRVPNRVATIPAALAVEYIAANKKRLLAEKEEEKLKAAILSLDPDAEAFDWGDGGKWATYRKTETERLDVTALRENAPDVYGQFLKTTTSRTLRVVKKKVTN